ncbi:hypothetical protein GCM10029976_068000 [Kribbella albertanoniae]
MVLKRVLSLALIAAGVGGIAVIGPAASTVAADGPGIAVLPDVPEPEGSQFVPGTANYVPVTGKAATDIRSRQPTTSTTRVAGASGTYVCPGFSTIDDAVPLSAVMDDTFIWSTYAPYKVGDGSGNVNWKLNPHNNPSWYMWLHSLRWIGQGVTAAAEGDKAALDHVTAIVHDWVTDNPYSWTVDAGAHESTMHRTNVIICTRHAVLANLGVQTLPAEYSWIDQALNDHATFMINHWGGAGNHGTDESIALFGVGCTLNRDDYMLTAQDRLGKAITTAIDAEGATNEQSTGYAQFNYSLWGRAVTALTGCGVDPGTTISTRRELLAAFIAHATTPQANLHQIGDTVTAKTYNIAGTPMEYAASQGKTGTAPVDRVKVYSAGYVFGRSGWGTTTPFPQETAYSLRFGGRRALHGHVDHTSVTYQARGRDIIVDSGYSGHVNDGWRPWVLSPFAHSTLTTPRLADANPATKLTRYTVKPTADFFEMSDAPAAGVNRVRAVLVLRKPDVVVTLDRVSATTSQQFQTLWHLPSDQTATVTSRTAAVAKKAGENTRTVLLQVPYRGAVVPPGSTLVKIAQTAPKQGWVFPNITTRNAAPTVMFARIGKSVSMLSLVIPIRLNGQVGYTTRMSGTTYVIDLTVDGVKTSVGITGGGSLIRMS